MPYPNFSLQDVDPRSNETAYTTDSEVMRQANEIREAKRKYQEQRNQRVASGFSVAGGGINLIPHPAAKIIGGMMQLPDIYYDGKSVYDNPSSISNWIHLGLDGLNFIPGVTNIISDDILKIPGVIDDSCAAITGEDVVDIIRRKMSSTFNNKRSIKDKRNNRK